MSTPTPGSQILAGVSSASGLTSAEADYSNIGPGFSNAGTAISQTASQIGQPITFPGITLPSATNLSPASICGILNLLEEYPALVINRFIKKLALLQEIAGILEQAGDLLALPVLDGLAGIENLANLTIADYNAIRSACCFLNLPPANDSNLIQLISQLQSALGEILSFLNQHPYGQLNGLQDELDSLLDEAINSITGDISPLLSCLNSLCYASTQIITGIDTGNLSSFDVTGAQYANILSPTQTAKAAQVASLSSSITNLIGTPVTGTGFSVGPGAGLATAAPGPVYNTTTTDASGTLYVNGVAQTSAVA